MAPTQGGQAVPPKICPCLSAAAIPGYQHTPDSLSARATQFYINKIDAANKEYKLEDKGEPRALGRSDFFPCGLWQREWWWIFLAREREAPGPESCWSQDNESCVWHGSWCLLPGSSSQARCACSPEQIPPPVPLNPLHPQRDSDLCGWVTCLNRCWSRRHCQEQFSHWLWGAATLGWGTWQGYLCPLGPAVCLSYPSGLGRAAPSPGRVAWPGPGAGV